MIDAVVDDAKVVFDGIVVEEKIETVVEDGATEVVTASP